MIILANFKSFLYNYIFILILLFIFGFKEEKN